MKKRNTTIQRPDLDARYWNITATCSYTQRSKSRLYADPSFPRPIKIGPNTSRFLASEVRAWCDAREADARKVAA